MVGTELRAGSARYQLAISLSHEYSGIHCDQVFFVGTCDVLTSSVLETGKVSTSCQDLNLTV